MKKSLLALLFLCLFTGVKLNAQDLKSPDYVKIKKETSDSLSQFFYPKLLNRLQALDTTLTDEEYVYLYYGYTFQKAYQPYWRSKKQKDLNEVLKKKELSSEDYDLIISYTSQAIESFPFALQEIRYLSFAYKMKGDENKFHLYSMLYAKIFNTITASGNGETCEKAMHVISTSHEYAVLNQARLQSTGQALVGQCDYLSVAENAERIEGLYFNVSRLFEVTNEMFKK